MNNKALYKLSYGLFVLTSSFDGKDNGCIINTASQVTSSPNRISITINKENYTENMIKKSGKFNVSILSEKATFDLYQHFGFQSGKEVDKFANFSACRRSTNGLYYITHGANAYISAKVEQTLDLGSHTMFIAIIEDMEILNDDASATYEFYQSNIKPSFSNPTTNKKTVWRCTICGYTYEDEELPEDYICPLCKHPASDFERIDV